MMDKKTWLKLNAYRFSFWLGMYEILGDLKYKAKAVIMAAHMVAVAACPENNKFETGGMVVGKPNIGDIIHPGSLEFKSAVPGVQVVCTDLMPFQEEWIQVKLPGKE